MKIMLLGLLVFLGMHVLTTIRTMRAELISKIGERPYKGLYSLVSAIGLIMIAYGFGAWRAEGSTQLWYPPIWAKHLAIPLMLFASICIVSAYASTHLRVWLKHPMLVGVKTWALAHLLANGDLAGVVLFGSFLIWAVFDRIALKRRPPVPMPMPKLQADIGTVIAGCIVFAVLGYLFHPYVINIRVLSV